MYQDHLIVWIDHVEEIKDRAREVITVLESAQVVESRRQTATFSVNSGTEASSQTDQANPAQATSSVNLPGTSNLASGSIPSAGLSDTPSASCTVPQSAPFIASVGTTLDQIQSMVSVPNQQSAPIMSTGAGRHQQVFQAQYPPRSRVHGAENLVKSTNLDLALRNMNSIGQTIHLDLMSAEEESSAEGALQTEGSRNALMEFCALIKQDIEVKYREAGEKAVRMAEWPSNRLDTCSQFMTKTPKERGELIEKIKGCYKCTSFKHKGNGCYIRKTDNCTVTTGGVACAGAHNKLLHGSGIAFCHKVQVTVNANAMSDLSHSGQANTERPPDVMQPVLLEIQQLKVHGLSAKLMWDNGSSAALVTHSFADRAGLKGTMVTYWLAVVGHERVLRNTMLYTLYLEDNHCRRHEVQAFGIDVISEDSVSLDLSGVKSVFPGAPKEVYNRPDGAIDILIGSAYRNLQP